MSPQFEELLIKFEICCNYLIKECDFTQASLADSLSETYSKTSINRALGKRKNPKISIKSTRVMSMLQEVEEKLMKVHQTKMTMEAFYEIRRADSQSYFQSSSFKFFYPSIPQAEINEKIRNAKHKIKILETNIYAWEYLNTYLDEALKKTPSLEIEILLLRPNSFLAEIRKEVIDTGEHIAATTSKHIEALSALAKSHNAFDRIHLKLYEQLPVFANFVIDDCWYSSVYWAHSTTLKAPWVFLPENQDIPPNLQDLLDFKKELGKNFKSIWEDYSVAIDLQNFEESFHYVLSKWESLRYGEKRMETLGKDNSRESIAGTYEFFFVNAPYQSLRRVSLRIQKTGKAEFSRESASLRSNGTVYPLESSRFYKLELSNDTREVEYNVIFRLGISDVIKGVYAGVENKLITGGRALALKISNDPEIPFPKSQDSFDWDGPFPPEFEREKVIDFFLGRQNLQSKKKKNYILDSPMDFGIDPAQQWMGINENIEFLAGVYSVYYLSTDEVFKIRRHICQIYTDGRLRMKSPNSAIGEHHAFVNYKIPKLTIRFFEASDREKFTWMLSALLYPRDKGHESFSAVMNGFPSYEATIARRVFFIKEDYGASPKDLKSMDECYENLVPLRMNSTHSEEFKKILKIHPELEILKLGPSNNFLKAFDDSAQKSSKDVALDLGNAFFRSACYMASHYDWIEEEVQIEFRRALEHGFSDQQSLNEEFTESFKNMKQEILEVIAEREDWRVVSPETKKSG